MDKLNRLGEYWVTTKDCDVKEGDGIGHGAYAKTIDGIIACARVIMGRHSIPYHRLSVFHIYPDGTGGIDMEELGTVEELVYDRHELRKLLTPHNTSKVSGKE